MKKIGKAVHLLPRVEGNLRNGEGSFLRLNDGRILYAYTKYSGDGWDDHHQADIAACYSSDEGESWSESEIFYKKPESAMNIMSVSLLRMENGDLGMIYAEKTQSGEKILCMLYLVRSSDEGKTFSAPLSIINEPGYYVLVNDRVLRMKNGRIIFTVADHTTEGAELIQAGVAKIYYSDDDGRSFQKAVDDVHSPYNDNSGLTEPGIYELSDGRLWLYARTGYTCQYQSFSEDGGIHWMNVAEANRILTSSESPMLVRDAGEYTFAILNPIPFGGTFAYAEHWLPHKDRTPFVIIADKTGGLDLVSKDFSKRVGDFMPYVKQCYYLEDDRSETYCYPTLFEAKDGIIVAYYYSDGSGKKLASGRITKILYSEIE